MGWSQPANQRAKELSADFKKNLREIADQLASHDKAASVAPLHVDRAFDALGSVGLSKRRWPDRPDAETALGGTLVGFAFAIPDAVSCFYQDTNKGVSQGLLIAFFVVGVFLISHGAYRGTLPSASSDESSVWWWARRIVLWLMVGLVAGIMGYLIYDQFLGTSSKFEPPSAKAEAKPQPVGIAEPLLPIAPDP